MTVLSKKKANQEQAEEASDSPTRAGPLSHSLATESVPNNAHNSEGISHERLNTTPIWSPRGEKRNTHSSCFDDFESSDSGPSQAKRRHRSSPKLKRNKQCERNSSATTNCSVDAVSLLPGTSRDEDGSVSGYNSGDEYGPRDASGPISEADWNERDRWFENNIRQKGFIIKQMEQDGACLFRAVADQVYGDQEMHTVVRHHCMNYIEANGDYFSQYVTEDLNSYVKRKRNVYVHGNHIEVQAMSEMYNRPVEVYCYGTEPINIFRGKDQNSYEPIRLSYHRGSHYNSVVDPYKATIGVGLGLPSYTPGLAEKNLMKEAINQSERFDVEQAMLEDKLRATDWEATNEAIEEQIARESYLQWLRDNEQRNRSMQCSPSATCSSATVTSDIMRRSSHMSGSNSPSHTDSHRNSPSQNEAHPSSPKSFSNEATAGTSSASCSDETKSDIHSALEPCGSASFINHLSPEMCGLSEWEDEVILAQVLAKSQEEYIDRFKKNREVCSEGSANDSVQSIECAEPSSSR